MTTHTSTCSNKTVTYNIIGDLKVELEIQDNPYQIPLEDLFLMAARINKKRSFLFVSQVLGKHIPINPSKGILVGALLAAQYMEVVKGKSSQAKLTLLEQFIRNKADSSNLQPFIDENYKPIIIGFAETATALGHAFFNAFQGADFFHTTREMLDGVHSTITFEEEHSHATSHRSYISNDLLQSSREVILVDDEITTGKTAVNIIRSIQEQFPRKSYTIVSILDWRSDENVQIFKDVEKELGISIHTVSLVKGTVKVSGVLDPIENEEKEKEWDIRQDVSFLPIRNPQAFKFDDGTITPYTLFTGRFGLSSDQNKEASNWMKTIGEELAERRGGKKSLVLGTGEFMYIPMKVASHMGEQVFYHSSTRSPIYPLSVKNYGAQSRYSFQNPESPSIQNFLYNIGEHQYDEIFIFFERKVELPQLQGLLDELKRTKITDIKIVYLSEKEGEF